MTRQQPLTLPLQVAVKFKNNVGYTPLHLAAKLGYVRVVEELLAVGANAALKDKVGLARVLAYVQSTNAGP